VDERTRAVIEQIRRDSSSGATAILLRAIEALRATAAHRPRELGEIAYELCRSQPSMGGLRTAAHLATTRPNPVAELDRLLERVRRAAPAIGKHAASILALRRPHESSPLRIVTCSSSAAVEAALVSTAHHLPVIAACAESRPALEGRHLAIRLAERGVLVEMYSDAGISQAIKGAEAVLVGADAVGPDSFINKVGTGLLCAHAATQGLSVYVVAGREKFVPADVFDSLELRSGLPEEIWDQPPENVHVFNTYFERVSLSIVTTMITDAGAVLPTAGSALSLWV
jgi:translation initiation factor 2B subunit (eIF-2B alpha/beta/delta family)